MDDIDIVNAELSLQEYFEEDGIDFRTDQNMNEIGLASDLMFILDNTKIHEPEDANLVLPDICLLPDGSTSSSETEDSDSTSSEVKVLEVVPKNPNQPILISSSDESVNTKTSFNRTKNKETLIVRKLLSSLTLKVDRIVNGEDLSGNDSDDNNEIDFHHEKLNLAAIIQDESKISNYIPKVQNEVLLEELPIIEDEEDIKLTSEDTIMVVGSILSVVDKMIVVEADKSAPALDAESAFFLSSENYLGKVFDTFGPVKHPFYSIRLSARTDLSKLIKGTKVFFVPFNKELTKYVFVEQLKNLKGSDASWKGDQEPPVEFLDYSDEEEERLAKQKLKAERKGKFQTDLSKTSENQNIKGASFAARNRLARRFHGTNPLMDHAIEHQPFKGQCKPTNFTSNKVNDLSGNDKTCPNRTSQAYQNGHLSQTNAFSNLQNTDNFRRDSSQLQGSTNDASKRVASVFPMQTGPQTNHQNPNFKSFVELSSPRSSFARPSVPARPQPTISNQRFEPVNTMQNSNFVPQNCVGHAERFNFHQQQSEIPLEVHNRFSVRPNFIQSQRQSNPNGINGLSSFQQSSCCSQEVPNYRNLNDQPPNHQNGFYNQQAGSTYNNQSHAPQRGFYDPESVSNYNINDPQKRFDNQPTAYSYGMNDQPIFPQNRYENQQTGRSYQSNNDQQPIPHNNFYNPPSNGPLQNQGQFIVPHSNIRQPFHGHQSHMGYQPRYQTVNEQVAGPLPPPNDNLVNNNSIPHQPQQNYGMGFNFPPNQPSANLPTPNHLVNPLPHSNHVSHDFPPNQSSNFSHYNQNVQPQPYDNYVNQMNHQSHQAWPPSQPQNSYDRHNFRSLNRY